MELDELKKSWNALDEQLRKNDCVKADCGPDCRIQRQTHAKA